MLMIRWKSKRKRCYMMCTATMVTSTSHPTSALGGKICRLDGRILGSVSRCPTQHDVVTRCTDTIDQADLVCVRACSLL